MVNPPEAGLDLREKRPPSPVGSAQARTTTLCSQLGTMGDGERTQDRPSACPGYQGGLSAATTVSTGHLFTLKAFGIPQRAAQVHPETRHLNNPGESSVMNVRSYPETQARIRR